MTDDEPIRDADGRFVKGSSGNRRGRRRGKEKPTNAPTFAFDVLDELNVSVHDAGEERVLSPQDALQHSVLQDAFRGKRLAQRKVLNWILEREKQRVADWHRERMRMRRLGIPTGDEPEVIEFVDPEPVDDVLELLGIASMGFMEITGWDESEKDLFDVPDGTDAMMLETWAVQAALDRDDRKRKARNGKRARIAERTHHADQLVWPKRYDDA